MNSEVELKVKIASIVKQIITDWQDDIGYEWTNRECAKYIAKALMEKFEIKDLTSKKYSV